MRGTNERMGGSPQAQENKSKMIQAGKTLERRDRVLTAAIRRCHVELAKKESLWDIEASKDAVEAAWKEFNHANSRYCVYAGWDPLEKDNTSDKQPEEVRRAGYEWKVLTNMMDQVIDEAEEYLESATKEINCDELREDEDGGNELDAEMEVRFWVEQLSIMSKVNEMALEVSAANEMNVNEVNDVNKVNEESTVNKDDCVVCNIKEVAPEMSYSMIKEVEIVVEAKVEVLGMKELKDLKDDNKVEMFDVKVKNGKKAEAKQSRPANWDPGELPDAKDQMEMLDMEEVVNLVNIDKVGLQLSVKEVRSSSGAIEKALLIVLFMLRFVNGFRRKCPIELSDDG